MSAWAAKMARQHIFISQLNAWLPHLQCSYTLSHQCEPLIVYASQDHTVYPKKYAHGFVVLCFVVVMQSFIMNSHEVFIHIHQGCFAGTGAIVRLPQCQWSKPDGYGKISQCITTTKHSKAKTVCIFLGIYCMSTEFLSTHWGRHKINAVLQMTFSNALSSMSFEVIWLKFHLSLFLMLQLTINCHWFR